MPAAIQESTNGTSPYIKTTEPYQLDIKEPLGLTECAILAIMELYVENNLECRRFNLVKVCRAIFPQIPKTRLYKLIARLHLHKLIELKGFKDALMRSLISNAPVALRQLEEAAPELYYLLPSAEEFVRLVDEPEGKDSMSNDPSCTDTTNAELSSALQNQVSRLEESQQHLTDKLQSLAHLYEVLAVQHSQLQLVIAADRMSVKILRRTVS